MKRGERFEAIKRGKQTYFTGKPCKRGHVVLRIAADGQCIACRHLKATSQHKKEYDRRDRRENPEKYRLKKKLYRINNKHIINADCAKRRARKVSATPKWVNLQKIKEIYRNCPEGHHVDHIFPLLGKDVCGLHVENNLQYLTAEENLRKKNKVEIVK